MVNISFILISFIIVKSLKNCQQMLKVLYSGGALHYKLGLTNPLLDNGRCHLLAEKSCAPV